MVKNKLQKEIGLKKLSPVLQETQALSPSSSMEPIMLSIARRLMGKQYPDVETALRAVIKEAIEVSGRGLPDEDRAELEDAMLLSIETDPPLAHEILGILGIRAS